MVNGQLRTSDVNNSEILAAFLDVAREEFTAANAKGQAYIEGEIAASGPPGRKLLAPRTLGMLLQAVKIQPGERVLDVGGGSGYGAAVIAKLGASVVLLETDTKAARAALSGIPGVECLDGDLDKGAPAKSPFDVIVINGGFAIAPDTLLAQLTIGGRLVGIDCRDGANHGVLIDRTLGGFSARYVFDARADVLPGFAQKPSFVF